MQGFLMEGLKQEFVFSMQVRKLSGRTIDSKQIGFLLRYAKEEFLVNTIEGFTSQIIKQFLLSKMETCKPQYINDLLKAFKVFFRYIHEEGYTTDILTNRIKNVKQPKVKIISFNKKICLFLVRLARFIDFYIGFHFKKGILIFWNWNTFEPSY
jgi:integrase/recombinase XerD